MKHDVDNLKDKLKNFKRWCWYNDGPCTTFGLSTSVIACMLLLKYMGVI